jgi:GNAT superfamily N-acetyltransferase
MTPATNDLATAVRPRQPSDLPALVAALEDVYRTDGYPVEGPSGAEAFLSPRGLAQAWVAEHAGVVVGQIVVVASRDSDGARGQQELPAAVRAWVGLPGGAGDPTRTVVVARFFVQHAARRLGLGRGLIERACAWARDRKMAVVMNVMGKDVDAMRLYEKVGFRRIGEGEYAFGHGETCLQFFLCLRVTSGFLPWQTRIRNAK